MSVSDLQHTATKKVLLGWRRLLSMASPILEPNVDTSHIWRNEDWEICCILDACRPDVLQRVLDNDIDTVLSGAPMSKPWYLLTFCSETTPDLSHVGLISGNPWVDILSPDAFGYVHFEDVKKKKSPHSINTVPPEPLAEHAIQVWRDRDKIGVDRLIVHFMQPHIPFRTRPEWFEGMDEDGYGAEIYWDLASGRISRDDFLDAYADNTEWVLEDGVEPITANCDADIVITADHSTGIGEWGVYSHPEDVPLKTLQIVPWVHVRGTDQGTITPNPRESSTTIEIDEQLDALGYK